MDRRILVVDDSELICQQLSQLLAGPDRRIKVAHDGTTALEWLVERNFSLYTQVLLQEVKPLIETQYSISSDRKDHAIAGLSMGGGESLLTGLNHPDEFAYVGAFSSGIQDMNFDQSFPNLLKNRDQFKLLWVACGVDDHLITPNRAFTAWLKEKQIPTTVIETPGRHTWMVWRDNLIHFAPLLFRN